MPTVSQLSHRLRVAGTCLLWALGPMAGSSAAESPTAEAVGTNKHGSQVGAVALPEEGADHYLLFPPRCYRQGHHAQHYPGGAMADNFYAQPSVVEAVLDVARQVREQHAGAPRLAIGELSHVTGGEIPFHLSHQRGLDVDVWYAQRPQPGATREHPVIRCTHGPSFEERDPETRAWRVSPDLDLAWNWTLASAFAARSDVKVIFVGGLVRPALEAWARAHDVPRAERRRTMSRLRAVYCRAPPGLERGTYKNNNCPHHDHFHVRFRCPASSPRCR